MFIAPFLVLTGCVTNTGIGVKTDFQQAQFIVGKSTKSDVISYLGLPQKIVKDAEGRDHLFYEGASRLVGLCIGCGHTNAGPGLVPSLMNEHMVKNGAEYVFSKDGILITKFEPTE